MADVYSRALNCFSLSKISCPTKFIPNLPEDVMKNFRIKKMDSCGGNIDLIRRCISMDDESYFKLDFKIDFDYEAIKNHSDITYITSERFKKFR